MKNLKLLFIMLLGFALSTQAQVKIGDNPTILDPSAVLELESTTLGFLPTRMTEAERDAIANPATALMLYNTSVPCLQINMGTPAIPSWVCISSQAISASSNGTGVVSSYGAPSCAAAVLAGTMTEGVAVSGVTATIQANVTTLGDYNISTTANGVTYAGAGTFTALGCQDIVLTATGTPTAAGTHSFATNTSPATSFDATTAAAISASTNGTGEVSSYGAPSCAAAVLAGTMTEGVAVSGVTATIQANVTTLGDYNISTTANGVTYAGTGTFTALGCQDIVLTATGTPTAAGTHSFATNTSPATSFDATTDAAVVAPPTNPVGSGSLSGKTCFDVAISAANDNLNGCGPLATRTPTQADFTQAATHTQSYTFTPSGTVSNVRFVYVNTNGSAITAISGNNTANNISSPVVATVNYSTSLNGPATGLTAANALTADIYVIYNDGLTNNGTDNQLKLTANIKDCSCCGAFVAAGVFKTFMCHNLGADESLDPNVPVQGIHGNYYQWGRSTVVADASTPAGAISGWNTTNAPNGAWSDATKTATDPCPSGYRVPTNAQWTGVANAALNTQSNTGSFANSATNFGSAKHFGPDASTKTLTLPAAGYRSYSNGTLNTRGYNGRYWSSTENSSTRAHYLNFVSSTATTTSSLRANGFSVRCVSE
ncbi:MAG: FISUMP domain-containing protein [Chitinophagales bacterium]